MFKFLIELDKSDEELKEQEELKKRKIEEALKEAQSRQNPEGNFVGEGNVAEGNVAEGNVAEGNVAEGNVPEGN